MEFLQHCKNMKNLFIDLVSFQVHFLYQCFNIFAIYQKKGSEKYSNIWNLWAHHKYESCKDKGIYPYIERMIPAVELNFI